MTFTLLSGSSPVRAAYPGAQAADETAEDLIQFEIGVIRRGFIDVSPNLLSNRGKFAARITAMRLLNELKRRLDLVYIRKDTRAMLLDLERELARFERKDRAG